MAPLHEEPRQAFVTALESPLTDEGALPKGSEIGCLQNSKTRRTIGDYSLTVGGRWTVACPPRRPLP